MRRLLTSLLIGSTVLFSCKKDPLIHTKDLHGDHHWTGKLSAPGVSRDLSSDMPITVIDDNTIVFPYSGYQYSTICTLQYKGNNKNTLMFTGKQEEQYWSVYDTIWYDHKKKTVTYHEWNVAGSYALFELHTSL